MHYLQKLVFLLLLFTSCHSGKLDVIADLPMRLKEASAIETVAHSKLLWTIEDAGNKNNIYGMDLKGNLVKNIDISNSSNIDWEDLTADAKGNLYIGDFGNNSKNRDDFIIYKVSNLKDEETTAERINFTLPKSMKAEDFEAFFILNKHFYVFSKENKSTKLFKVPNTTGKHTAEFITEFNMKGKHTKITAADVSDDGKTILLLNHDKLWKITNFTGDNFFKGDIQVLDFNHDSQKEGVCFKNETTVYITDEKNKSEGGNLYMFNI